MRIRTFTAATTPAAMALVREEMGEAAIIIAVDQASNGQGVIVRAAADETAETRPPALLPAASVEDRLEALLRARLSRPRQLSHAA